MKRENIRILYQYIASSNDWCSADELAIHLHTTARTIHNYIREINRSVPKGTLILSSHKGYRWNKDFADTSPKPTASMRKNEIPTIPNHRYWYIIRKIIVEQIDIDSLIDSLSISGPTIDTDIQKVREIAKSFHIRLRRKKDVLSFAGKEADIRRLIFQCIMETTKQETLSYQFIIDAFPEYNCQKIHTILTNTLSAYGLRTNAYTQYDLLMRVVIQYRQIDRGMEIAAPECPIAGLRDYYEFAAANALADQFTDYSDIRYNLQEREYLAALFIAKTDTPYISKNEIAPEYTALRNSTVRLLQMAGDALHAHLLDEQFISYLVCHFQRMLVRQTMELFSKYPVFHSLKTSHPIIQDVSAWLLLSLSKQYRMRIDRNEVGILTEIFCGFLLPKGYLEDLSVGCTIICPSFGNFPDELANTLTQHLGNAIHIHAIIDSLDIDNLKDSSELYLSVLPVQNIQHLVQISHYPRAADFRHIYTEIHKIKMTLYNQQFYERLTHILTKDTFEIAPSLPSKTTILDYMCHRLKKLGYVQEGFSEDIMERESIDSSVFCGNIALPHTSGKNICRSFAYIILSKQPMLWEQNYVNIICMFGTEENHLREMQILYDLAIKVFSFYPNVNALLNACDTDSFLDILHTMEILL